MALNPQQLAFKEAYTNPNSETFGNAYRSALSAGFADEYAKTITAQGVGWVSEIINDLQMLQQAEGVLKKTLTFVDADDSAKQRIAQDSAKFITSRLGRGKYAERQEFTGAGGESLNINLSKLDDAQLAKLTEAVAREVRGTVDGTAQKEAGESA